MRHSTRLRLWNLFEMLRGRKWVFELDFYRESELSRLANLFAHVDINRWRGMKVLEVGAGLGRLGDAFATLGFDVTSTDARAEHVERIAARGRKAFTLDLENPNPNDFHDYDIVLCFGVLYHLSDPEPFLAATSQASVLLLETMVTDSRDNAVNPIKEPTGWRGRDQAHSGTGCRPSPTWIEDQLRQKGWTDTRDISTTIANWSNALFDWQLLNDGTDRRDGRTLRKMWVCEKTETGSAQ